MKNTIKVAINLYLFLLVISSCATLSTVPEDDVYVQNNPTLSDTEELNDDLFLQLYVKASIKGWSGLKLEYLEQLAPVDITGQDPTDELPYSEENALFLMKNSSNFDAAPSISAVKRSIFRPASGSISSPPFRSKYARSISTVLC